MGIKRNNAVGLKGRSGRKSASVEFAKNEAIQRAWEKVNRDIDKEDTVKIALPIALKDMTNNVDIKSDGKELKTLTKEDVEAKLANISKISQ